MPDFVPIELSAWGFDTPLSSPSDILDRLIADTEDAIREPRIISIDIETANDFEHSEFRRVFVELSISNDLFASLLNGRGGYRAQYALSESEGDRFNRRAVCRLAEILVPQEKLYAERIDRELFSRSLTGMHTKLWFPKDISDPSNQINLSYLPEKIIWKPWRNYWSNRIGPRKGLIAPDDSEYGPRVLLNGTFLTPDWRIWDQKPNRGKELHERGWV